jgi:CelD/BcsL family acetyltransferase involved in cellulose biosynthesis
MNFDIVNPLEIPNWDDLVLATGKASIFHSSAWARVLHESYGYKPVYFTSFDGGNLVSLLPLMEIDSWLTGRRAVSLPFSDYCDPVIPEGGIYPELLGKVIDQGRKANWKYIEWRSQKYVEKGTVPCASFFGHRLSLTKDLDELLRRLKSNTRRNIKTSIRTGVDVRMANSPEGMRSFFDLHVQTRRRHGLPPQPFAFFEKTVVNLIQRDLGSVALATYQNRIVAGMVFLHFGSEAVYKYGASDPRYLHVRPNNAIMWKAIKKYKERGVKELCFGRTAPWQEGLLQFKRGWGAAERRVEYYRYDLKREKFIEDWIQVNGFHNRVFRRCPISVLKLAGQFLYKHIG